jgi:hypothetical protein
MAGETRGTGIEVSIFNGNDPYGLPIVTLPNVSEVKGLDEIKGPGGGSFQVHLDDPVLARYPNCLDYYNIVRVYNDGLCLAAYEISDINNIQVDKSENASRYREVSGQGLRGWFRNATVQPYKGLRQDSYTTRNFNFASEVNTWYNPAEWTNPWGGTKQSDPPEINNWPYGPEDWPDAPDARWIWDRPFSATQPQGDVYFRYTLSVPSEAKYSFFVAADDTFDLYVDAQLLADHHDNKVSWSTTTQVDITLGPGDHVVGFKVTNDARGGRAGLLCAIFRYGNPAEPTAAQLVAQTAGGDGWRCLGYPAIPPAWTPGEVMLTLLEEARARGVAFVDWITPDFTRTHDSNGELWDRNVEWSFKVGTEYYDVITKLEELSCDVFIDPELGTLQMWKERSKKEAPGDYPQQPQFELGKNIGKATESGKADIKTRFNILTDDGWVTEIDYIAENKYGIREGTLETNNSKAFAKTVAKAAFTKQGAPEDSAALTIFPTPGMVPFKDYKVGDWVIAPAANGTGTPTKRRIVSLAFVEDTAGNITYSAEFDTITENRLQKLERWLANATASASSSSGGGSYGSGGGSSAGAPSGGAVSSPASNRRPSFPVNFSAQGEAVWVENQAVGYANLRWDPVSLGVDEQPISVSGYEVWGQRAFGAADAWMRLTTVTTTSAIINNLAPGDRWFFRVRAISALKSGIYSIYSTERIVNIPQPVTRLDRPTNANLTSKYGVLNVRWDGALVSLDGLIWPPPQFDYVYAAYSTELNGAYTRAGSSLTGQGTTSLTDLDVGTVYYVKLYAVDRAGFVSQPSIAQSLQVVGVDLGNLDGEVATAIKAAEDAAKAAAALASGAQTTADGKGKIWYLPSAPASPTPSYNFSNDLWFDTSHGNLPMRWDGVNGWVSAQDLAVRDALAAGQTALTTANGKNTTWYQDEEPARPQGGFTVGDLWFDTNDGNTPYVFDGNDWASAADERARIAAEAANSSASDAIEAAAAAVEAASQAQSTADGKGEIIYSATAPPGNFSNLWFDQANGANTPKRWDGNGWVAITDAVASNAQLAADAAELAANNASKAASGALLAANGKNTVYRFPQRPATPQGGFRINDTWFDTANGNAIYLWDGADWTSAELGTSAIADLAITNAKIGNLDAAKITTGILNADHIAANSITVDKLTIGSFDNLMLDPAFDQGGKSWTLPLGALITPNVGRRAGTPALVVSHGSATQVIQQSPSFKTISGGASYLFTVWMKTTVSTPVTLGVTWRRATGSNIYGTITPETLIAGQWTKISRVVDAPEDAVEANFYIEIGANRPFGTYTIDFVAVTRAANGELIVDGSITTGKIVSGAITTRELNADAVTAEKIQAGAIVAGKIDVGAVTADTIQAGAITAGKIQAGAVTAGTLAAGAVTAGTIAAGAITTEKIQAGAITAQSGIIGSLDAGVITSGTLNAGRIAANAITSDKIAAGAITAGKLDANAVTAGTIQAGAITADKIGAAQVTAGKLSADSVAAVNIQALAITAEKIGADAITANKIAAGAIETDKIAAGAIQAQHLDISVGGRGTQINRLAAPITDRNFWTRVKNGTIKFNNDIFGLSRNWQFANVTAEGIIPGTTTGSGGPGLDTIVTDSHPVPISRQLRVTINGASLTGSVLKIAYWKDAEFTIIDTAFRTTVSEDRTVYFPSDAKGWFAYLDSLTTTATRITALEIYEVAGGPPGQGRINIDPAGVTVYRADDSKAVFMDQLGIHGRTSAGDSTFDITSQGISVYQQGNIEAARMGYGSPTGFSIRNPTTNSLQPLASHVFGTVATQASGMGSFISNQNHAKRFLPLNIASATATSVSGRFLVTCSFLYQIRPGTRLFVELCAYSTTNPQTNNADRILIEYGLVSGPYAQDETKVMYMGEGVQTIQGILYLPVGQSRVLGFDMTLQAGQYANDPKDSYLTLQSISAVPV